MCGSVVDEDVVVRLRKVQLLVDGKEETAIAAYWVTDGEDRCCVGFLQSHMVAYASRYDCALAQVTRVLVGTLKDGYIRKVPLPRAPLQQSPEHVTASAVTRVPHATCYSQVPRVPTWSNLTKSLFGGLGARLLRASLLM